MPVREDLDRAAPANPVALEAKSGHALWVSSRALEAAGITDASRDPPGGKIVRHGGRATGILLENAMRLVQGVMPAPSAEELSVLMADAQAALHRSGLTGVHDFDSALALQALQLLEARGALTLRVLKGIPRELLPQAKALGLRTGFGGGRLTLGPLKLFADGALGPQTAWMLEPYGGSTSRGIPTLTEAELQEDIRTANRAGISCAVHAIGDAACRAVLDAFEKVAGETGGRQAASAPASAEGHRLPNRIEHVQLLHPDDLPRLTALGVAASMQPLHATSDMLIADRHWGERGAGAYAWQSLLASGALLAFGSDCPVEIPDPLAGIHAAVTRRRADGSPGPEGWRPAEKLSVEQAVLAYTRGAARAGGRQRELGSIGTGMLADLTVLDHDIFAIDLHEIRNVRTAATLVGGAFVFRDF
jgi:hypothetical protein